MESFTEAWNKLKDLHEKEVVGLQTKLADLTMEKCRDAQRIEELFAKNHLLREQQKVLNENVKVLENRLRAGLCDRCTVTQEMAKKKQQEFESTHFQSLQHISSLTNEINGLKEDNKSLAEELNVLRNSGFCSPSDRTKAQPVLTPDYQSTPNSPLPLASPGARQKILEKTPSGEDVGREDSQFPEEKTGSRHSPGSRTSPAANVTPADHRLYEMRISNQLHGTIAVVRPGSGSCPPERSSEGPTQTPCNAAGQNYHSDADTNSSQSWERASLYETLNKGSREEHLYRLNQHLSQHQTGLRSHAIPMDTIGRFSSHILKAREAELVRKKSTEDWEERAPVVGRVVYLSEKDLRGKLSILEQHDRLQYFRTRKQQQLQWAREQAQNSRCLVQTFHERPATQTDQEDRGQCRERRNEVLRSPETLERHESGPLHQNPKKLESGETARVVNNCPPEKPLDLSDYGRGRDTHKGPDTQCQLELNPQSPVCKRNTSPPDTGTSTTSALHKTDDNQCSHGSCHKRDGNSFHEDYDTGQASAEDGEKDSASSLDWKSSLEGHDTGRLTSCTRQEGSGIRLRLSVRRQNSEQDCQADDEDGESTKRESDEAESSDSEVESQYATESNSQSQAEESKSFCTKDKVQGMAKKRKRGHDIWTKAHRRFTKGRKKARVLQVRPTEEQMDNSTPSGNNAFRGT
ncbi:RBBP8 N-terminal-like protein isoform X1 [Ambystoma mexicanum]|uniref:RBBP8 N-terminal-like protein isoform X1 n=1 Tax=Ambystoma mexicanum TaxID=8296 RepID=UPI0037E8C2BE